MPDTAETEWLDRHAQIWLLNADGSIGRKLATLAYGSVSFFSTGGFVTVPANTQLSYSTGVTYETLEDIVVSDQPTSVSARALDPGTIGNLLPGTVLSMSAVILGLNNTATVVEMANGTDTETDDELRMRVLLRIREPPMGGAANDFVEWALSYPGVTRAWSYPLEMGMGTVTVRFMMDDLRASNNGFPYPQDITNVDNYLNTVRPVAVKDFFTEAPIPFPINVRVTWLNPDSASVRDAIVESLQAVFLMNSKPGQTWYRAWTDQGIMNAVGVIAYDLVGMDVAMSSNGYMPVLGDVTWG
jgi:uncharacterized phage protein gp47/JayE